MILVIFAKHVLSKARPVSSHGGRLYFLITNIYDDIIPLQPTKVHATEELFITGRVLQGEFLILSTSLPRFDHHIKGARRKDHSKSLARWRLRRVRHLERKVPQKRDGKDGILGLGQILPQTTPFADGKGSKVGVLNDLRRIIGIDPTARIERLR